MIVEEKELDQQNLEDVDSEETNSEENITPEEGENAAETAEEAEASNNKKDKKKSFLGKDKKSNKLQEKVDELEDRVKRQMAEFDNFRKI